jgi:hypothetical protein
MANYPEMITRYISQLTQPFHNWRPDINEISGHINIIEELDTFAEDYSLDGPFGITNTLRWKPNSKKTVKARYDELITNNGLRNPLGAKSMARLLQTNYNRWMSSNMITKITDIESKIDRMRYDGLTLDCDEDVANEVLLEHANILEEAPYNFHVAPQGLLMRELNDSMNYLSPRRNKPFLVFPVCLNNINIRMIVGDDEVIGEIPYGDLIMLFEVDLYWWLNAMLTQRARGHNIREMMYRRAAGRSNYNKIFHFTAMAPRVKGNLHPYVQRNHDSYQAGNTCLGHLQTPIYNSLINGNWELFHSILTTWASTYHMADTGPLNTISLATVGINKYWPEAQKERLQVNFDHCLNIFRANYVENPQLMAETHCVDCIKVDNCRIFDEYIDNTNANQRKLTTLTVKILKGQFPYGCYMIDLEEEIKLAFDRNVRWEFLDSNDVTWFYIDLFDEYIALDDRDGLLSNLELPVKEYLGSLVEKELDYGDYLFYKNQVPRCTVEAERLDTHYDAEMICNIKFQGVQQWKSIDRDGRKELISTYREIWKTNKEREVRE